MAFLNMFSVRGNTKLKKPGAPIEFTQDNALELLKCMEDPIYFIKNYVKIVHVDKGLVPFTLYPYQERYVKELHKNRFVVAKWPRQSGKCILGDTKLRIRNKTTGEIVEISAEEFHNLNRAIPDAI